jgi:hypothetical protein
MSLAKAQAAAIEEGFLDLLAEDKNNFSNATFETVADTLGYLAVKYIDVLRGEMDKKDVVSSGKLADSMKPTEVELNGTTYTIGILAKDYASYQDEGVDGWAKSQGSRFKFKTKGVNPQGEMVKSIKDWLSREGASARNVKVGISSRERKGMKVQDATTKAAVTTAYMVKKYGIKPSHFWRDATENMVVYVQSSLGAALKIDIINTLTK